MGTRRDPVISAVARPPNGIQERRTVCRYAVVQSNGWLGWWVGQEFLSTPAEILDISLRGAMLIVESFPTGLVLWFCPPGMPADDEWMEVKLIATKKRLFGPREVRIAFRKVFPYEVFKALVYGQEPSQIPETNTWLSQEPESRDWW